MDFVRKLPIGIRDFEKLREENYLYVDKTDLIFKMVHSGSYYFLCRPRCFGKSLLVSTLEAYFKGRRDLFEGLKIENLEEDWQEYPVFKIEFSADVYTEEGVLEMAINTFLTEWEQRYGRHEERTNYARRFEYILHRAYETSGKPLVILIDDYDKPILDAVFSPEETHNRELLRSFYTVLNANDYYLKFVFMTGISKYASVNIFNGSNQFKDISMYSDYNTLCGFTKEDIEGAFKEELKTIDSLIGAKKGGGERNLLAYYDGYRFSRTGGNVCNPFSILCALDAKEFSQYWFNTGIPSMLIKMLQSGHYDLFGLIDCLQVDADDLMEYKWTETDLTSLIYQCGYLTIADYDKDSNLLTLVLPNAEVRKGFLKAILPFFTTIGSTGKAGSFVFRLQKALEYDDINDFMGALKEAVSDLTIIKQKKENPSYVYKLAFHTLLYLTGYEILSEPQVRGQHSEIILDTGETIYIFELKMDKNLDLEDVFEDAFARIDEKISLKDYEAQNRKVCKVAIVFSSSKGGVAGWKSK